MNIAEACGRQTDAEYVQFLQTSFASASEAEYQLLLARDLDYLAPSAHECLEQDVREVKRMLAAMLRTLRGRQRDRSPRRVSRRPDP
jgi:four helix bundle protein